jgi:hypothetical protein
MLQGVDACLDHGDLHLSYGVLVELEVLADLLKTLRDDKL